VSRIFATIRDWFVEMVDGWNRFWFSPADPATLGLIRIFAGSMLFYTHLVWSLDLNAFFGPSGWLPQGAVELLQKDSYSWSYLWWLQDSPTWLWTFHLLGLVVFAMLAVGLFSRVVSVLALIIALAYVHRVPGALFGLDQINVMLAMYLAVGPSGDAFSLDRWLVGRRAGGPLPVRASWTANLAIRLIQIHLCIIYLFAGMAKLTGPAWWDGTALWMALGNMEYQSLDMTWMAEWPRLINLLTHVTIFWELSYSALVWPRQTRAIVLALAIPLHMGIAICLGMITFGLAMLIANFAFVPSPWVRALWPNRPAEQGRGPAAVARSSSQPAPTPARSASSAKR
jgi:hypothetical protein